MQGNLCLFRFFVDIQPMVERQTSGPLHRQKQQQTLIDLQRERSRISRYNIKVGMWNFFPVFFLIPIHLVFINTTEAPRGGTIRHWWPNECFERFERKQRVKIKRAALIGEAALLKSF